MTKAEIAQIIIGIISIVATVSVSFTIYWLQKRHEKDVLRIEEQIKRRELEEKAHEFLIENENERDYLPWCIIAVNLHRHERHTRNIYTNFCRCSPELQNEILNIAGFSLNTISDSKWVEKCFEKLSKDIKKYHLGRDVLYDGAKYFHRSFEYYRDKTYEEFELYSYKTLYSNNNFIYRNLISLGSYIEEYLDYIMKEINEDNLKNKNPLPPVDYVWSYNNLSYADEYVVCFWIMELVYNIVINIHNRFKKEEKVIFENLTDADAITYEDKYYQALFWLYFTYKQDLID